MNRMSKKGRIWLTIGCFISSLAMVIACIILIRSDSDMASIISTGINALAFFVLAFVFMPPKGYVPVREEKKNEQPKPIRYKTYKDKKPKEPFVSDDEWEELEEEEEEVEMIEDLFDDK